MNSSTTPKLIDPSFFGGARVATVSTGLQHSAFVTVDGSLYMYGSMNPKHTYKEDWHAEGKGDMNNDDIPTAVAGRYIAAWYTGSATSDIFRAHGQSAREARCAGPTVPGHCYYPLACCRPCSPAPTLRQCSPARTSSLFHYRASEPGCSI